MRLRRAPVVDEVVVDGELVVMVGDTVLLIGPLAARLLELVGRDEVDGDELRNRLFAEFGEPQDPREDWKRLLSQLKLWRLLDVTDTPSRPA